jgi:hypothetical protein
MSWVIWQEKGTPLVREHPYNMSVLLRLDSYRKWRIKNMLGMRGGRSRRPRKRYPD